MEREVKHNSPNALLMQHFLTAVARGLVQAQMTLDERGRESIIVWERDGLPPTVWTWADCCLSFPMAFDLLPKATAGGETQLAIISRKKGQGKLTFTFRYVLMPQEEEVPSSHA